VRSGCRGIKGGTCAPCPSNYVKSTKAWSIKKDPKSGTTYKSVEGSCEVLFDVVAVHLHLQDLRPKLRNSLGARGALHSALMSSFVSFFPKVLASNVR
jgi:hypothetical protein